MAAPKLRHVFDFSAVGPMGFPVTASTHSNVCVAHVDVGTISLPDGTVILKIVTGSDWMTMGSGSTNVIKIDARVSAISDDGVDNMELEYTGQFEVTPEVEAVVTGTTTTLPGQDAPSPDHYYFTAPRIHSRSARWAWVNDAVFVARGHLHPNNEDKTITVTYTIYKVE